MDEEKDLMHEEKEEIEALWEEYNATKQPTELIQIAVKTNDLAELYLAVEQKYTAEFYEYKKKAGEVYHEVAKITQQPNAYLLSVLFYLQGNEQRKAERTLNKVKRKMRQNKYRRLIDADVVKIAEWLAQNQVKKTEVALKNKVFAPDPQILKEIRKTIKHIKNGIDQ